MPNPTPVFDQLMDWLYEQAGGSQTPSISLQPFMDQHGWDTGTGLAAVHEGDRRGLLNSHNGLAGPCASLTPSGIRQVVERRRRRSDPAGRAVAARTGLLRWMYAQKRAGVPMPFPHKMRDSEYGWFEGDQFTEDEVAQAAEHLAAQGLIKGPSAYGATGPLRASIQPSGEDCVEHYGGDVSRYLDSQRPSGSTTISIGSINNSGAMAIGSSQVHQQVTGVNSADLTTLVEVLLQKLPQLGLDLQQQGAARADLEEVQREIARREPDPERVTGGLQRFVERLDGPQGVVQLLAAIASAMGGLIG